MIEQLIKPNITLPSKRFKGCVDLTHGSGGRAMAVLIDELFMRHFDNPWLAQKEDQACFSVSSQKMAMSTDAFVISPLFFPGGDIGSLAVHGTVNDLAMSGAIPLYLSASFILEEGLPLSDLQRIVMSMANAAKQCDVAIITGDTKVVERGKGDGVFISTTGIGRIAEDIELSANHIQPGDQVILSGSMGDHGVAIMSLRHHLQFATTLQSDSAPLHELVHTMLQTKATLRCLRDPTRGGVATVLNEWAKQARVGFLIDEASIPVHTDVASACELLGLDPLYVANEGKLLAICAPSESSALLKAMQQHPLGRQASIIGEVTDDPYQLVQMKTQLGGTRVVDWLHGEPLPRIC